MSYFPEIVRRNEELKVVWVAATRGVKVLTRNEIIEFSASNTSACIERILSNKFEDLSQRLTFKLIVKLTNGIIKLFNCQVKVYQDECDNMLTTMFDTLSLYELSPQPMMKVKKAKKKVKVASQEVQSKEYPMNDITDFDISDEMLELHINNNVAKMADITMIEDERIAHLTESAFDSFDEPRQRPSSRSFTVEVMVEAQKEARFANREIVLAPEKDPENEEERIECEQPLIQESFQVEQTENQEATKISATKPHEIQFADITTPEQQEQQDDAVENLFSGVETKKSIKKRQQKTETVEKIIIERYTSPPSSRIDDLPELLNPEEELFSLLNNVSLERLHDLSTHPDCWHIYLSLLDEVDANLVWGTDNENGEPVELQKGQTKGVKQTLSRADIAEPMEPQTKKYRGNEIEMQHTHEMENLEIVDRRLPFKTVETCNISNVAEDAVQTSVPQQPSYMKGDEIPPIEQLSTNNVNPQGPKWYFEILELLAAHKTLVPVDICKLLGQKVTRFNMAVIFNTLLDLSKNGEVQLHSAPNSLELERVEKK